MRVYCLELFKKEQNLTLSYAQYCIILTRHNLLEEDRDMDTSGMSALRTMWDVLQGKEKLQLADCVHRNPKGG